MKRACLLLLLAVGCKNGPSEDQCKQLLDHLVDLEFKKAGAAASSDAMKADLQNKKNVSDKVSAAFMDTCKNKMSRSRVECALNANSLDGDNGVAKCDESK
jgi:hypothetical protein